ncbi:methyl-accepting chemotaxis protein, partial [Salmonella enterica]
TVKQNADNAHHASKLAEVASGKASRGGQMVSGVVQTMGNISTSSKKISEINAVINSIAFQNNILALNEAVEAARAG